HAGVPHHQLADAGDLAGVDADVDTVVVGPGVESHGHLLERGVAGALADAVDGRLDLRGSVLYRRQAVGDRQAEVVVAVRGDAHALGLGHVLEDRADQAAVLVGRAVTGGVGDVDGVGP